METSEYRLHHLVGSGATADVFYAERRGDDGSWHDVAFKRYRIALSGDAPFRLAPGREARAGAKLRHPNIAAVLDQGKDKQGRLFLAMEWVHGLDLDDVLDVLRPPIPDVVYIVKRVVEALAYAHAKGVIHRDISPQNVLLSRTGDVKLADFGLARGLLTDELSGSGFKGKIGYTAPEVAQRRPYDHRTDLYSVGVMLYQALTGRLPFRGHDVTSFVYQQMAGNPTPPGDHRPDIPEPLEAIILRLLARKPADRYDTARDLLAALAPLESGDSASLGRLVTVCSDGARAARWSTRSLLDSNPSPTHYASQAPGGFLGKRTRAFLATAAASLTLGVGATLLLTGVPSPPDTSSPTTLIVTDLAPNPSPEPPPTVPTEPEKSRHYDTLVPDPPVRPPDSDRDRPRQLDTDREQRPQRTAESPSELQNGQASELDAPRVVPTERIGQMETEPRPSSATSEESDHQVKDPVLEALNERREEIWYQIPASGYDLLVIANKAVRTRTHFALYLTIENRGPEKRHAAAVSVKAVGHEKEHAAVVQFRPAGTYKEWTTDAVLDPGDKFEVNVRVDDAAELAGKPVSVTLSGAHGEWSIDVAGLGW